MKLSTRVRYGVRAMVELAMYDNGKPVSLRQLAMNQDISYKYLEQMMAALKVAGLIESVRGAEGGYRLSRPAQKITVLDIYKVLDTSGELIDCQDPPCARFEFCAVRSVWKEMSDSIFKILQANNLRLLADKQKRLLKQHVKAG